MIIAYPRDDSFFEHAPFEYQLDPKMAKIDELLDDDRLILRASVDLAQSAPQALETGRPSIPVEVSLRLAVLRRLKGWSYRQVEDAVKGSLKWRGFCHSYDQRMPDHSTLQTREVLISAARLHDLNDWVAQRAGAEGVTYGSKLRADGSIVETHIHYPTDSSLPASLRAGLLADGVRVVGRTLTRARKVIDERTVRWQTVWFSNPTRKARRLAHEIAAHARRPGQKKPENRRIPRRNCTASTAT